MLLFDIGSGSVGGALMLASASHTPTILYSFRSEIISHSKTTGRRLLSHMLRSLSEVVSAITTEGFAVSGFGENRPRIQEVFVSLSAPWVISKTSFLSLHSAKPEVITQAVFKTLLEHARTEAAHSDPRASERVEIERKLIKTVINGYETSDPYGKEATEAQFAVFQSFSVPRITERVTDTIARMIHGGQVTFHSFSMVAFAVLRELFPQEESFLSVDVSGDQTEVAIVKKGALGEIVTFPLAKNHILRSLGTDAKTPIAGAAALVKLQVEGGSAGPLAQRTDRILEACKQEWVEKLFGTLSDLSAEVFLPRHIFLTADSDIAPLFADAIRTRNFNGLAMPAPGFDVTVLENETLTGLVRWSPSHTPDPFISLIAAVANRLRR